MAHLLQSLLTSNEPLFATVLQIRICVQNHFSLPPLHCDTPEERDSAHLWQEVLGIDIDCHGHANAPRRNARVVDFDVSFWWEWTVGFVDQRRGDPGHEPEYAAGVIASRESVGVEKCGERV